MAQDSTEADMEILPYQKYSQAMSICNSLAMLASQCTMVVFVQRIAVLKNIETCWIKGQEAEVVYHEGSRIDLEGDVHGIVADDVTSVVGVKLEPDFVDQSLAKVLTDDSSDDTIVDEPFTGGADTDDDKNPVKVEGLSDGDYDVKKTRKSLPRSRRRAAGKKDTTNRRGRTKPQKRKAKDQGPLKCDVAKESVTSEDPEASSYKFLCLICKEVFETFSELKEHKTQDHGPNTASSSSSQSLDLNPDVFEARVRKRIQCPVCDRTFRYAYELRRHSLVHTGEKPFMCSDCGMRFAKRDILKSHVRIHSGDRPFKCGHCEKHFIQASNLKYHIRSHHTGEKPFICTVCGNQFRQATLLKYHMRVHTGERPYVCSLCGRSFARPSHLREHRKMHSDAKTYSCRDCGKTFRQHGSLNKHRKIHLEVKPYSCSECGRTFTQLHNMKIHMRTHTGQKPYTCERCGKMFAHQGTLKKHFGMHLAEKQ